MPNYRTRELKADDGSSERYWTCDECGALVGPLTSHKSKHTDFHDRIDRIARASR